MSNLYNRKVQIAWWLLMAVFIILFITFAALLVCSLMCEDAYAMDGDDPYWNLAYAQAGFTYHVCAREILHQDYKQAILQAAIISAFKEVGDSMYAEGIFGTPDSGHWLMDARGGDPMDVFWCTLGAACVPFVYEIRGWTIKIGIVSP